MIEVMAPEPCDPCRGWLRDDDAPFRWRRVPFNHGRCRGRWEAWLMDGGPHHGERVLVRCACWCRPTVRDVRPETLNGAKERLRSRARRVAGDTRPRLPGGGW